LVEQRVPGEQTHVALGVRKHSRRDVRAHAAIAVAPARDGGRDLGLVARNFDPLPTADSDARASTADRAAQPKEVVARGTIVHDEVQALGRLRHASHCRAVISERAGELMALPSLERLVSARSARATLTLRAANLLDVEVTTSGRAVAVAPTLRKRERPHQARRVTRLTVPVHGLGDNVATGDTVVFDCKVSLQTGDTLVRRPHAGVDVRARVTGVVATRAVRRNPC